MDGKGLHVLPAINFTEANEIWTEDLDRGLDTFDERTRKAKLAMRKIRARRKDDSFTN